MSDQGLSHGSPYFFIFLIFLIFFKKTVDKPRYPWYNIDTLKERGSLNSYDRY